MLRPTRLDNVKLLAENFGPLEEMNIDPEDLDQAWRNAYYKDGYHLAKAMERLGYNPDAEMVATLDDFQFMVYEEIERLQKAWWLVSGITAKLKIGESIPEHLVSKYGESGTTVYMIDDKGCYYIGTEGVGGRIVPVETVDAMLE